MVAHRKLQQQPKRITRKRGHQRELIGNESKLLTIYRKNIVLHQQFLLSNKTKKELIETKAKFFSKVS